LSVGGGEARKKNGVNKIRRPEHARQKEFSCRPKKQLRDVFKWGKKKGAGK